LEIQDDPASREYVAAVGVLNPVAGDGQAAMAFKRRTNTPRRTPKATTVRGSMVGALRLSSSKYRTSPALDINPPVFSPLLIHRDSRPRS